ncbi:hypothetical protein [Alkaliphilus crotonatoxidans]
MVHLAISLLSFLIFLFFIAIGINDYFSIGDKEKIYIGLLSLIPSLGIGIPILRAFGYDIIQKNVKTYKGKIGKLVGERDERVRALVSVTISIEGKYVTEEGEVERKPRFICNYEPYFDVLESLKGKDVVISFLPKSRLIIDMTYLDGTPVVEDGQLSFAAKIELGRGVLGVAIFLPILQYFTILLEAFWMKSSEIMEITIVFGLLLLASVVIGILFYLNAGTMKRFVLLWRLWLVFGVTIGIIVNILVGIIIFNPDINSHFINRYLLIDEIDNGIFILKLIFYVVLMINGTTLIYLKNFPHNPKYMDAFKTYINSRWRRW